MKKKKECNEASLAQQYEALKADREPYLMAAKEAAKLTIPKIMMENADMQTTSNTKYPLVTPHQSVGADGVNNLAAKVVMVLLPPNQTFFKYKMDEAEIKRLAALSGEDESVFKENINSGLSQLETLTLDYMESFSDRVCLGEALKHLYITGNVMLIPDPETGLRYYPLSRFVIKRDNAGNVLKAITLEKVGFNALPEDIQEELIKKYHQEIADKDDKESIEDKEFNLYTGIKRSGNKWIVWQEADTFKIKGSEASLPIKYMPCIPLRYTCLDGESYGRGLIEDYYGDLSYLDTLCLAIKQTSLGASKLIMLVNPSGQTKIRQLASAKNGDYVAGKADDVQPLQANKYYDLQTAQKEADKIERRLNRIFVMKAAIQRDAERVTAEEIRQMATDLEEALGNHYSIMAKEFQLNYTRIMYYYLRKSKRNQLPNLFQNDTIKLSITTGLEALGKSSDLNKLVTFFDVLSRMAQSAQVVGAKTEKIAAVIAASLNLDIKGLFYTEEEKAQMQQQAQQNALINKVAPNIVNQLGNQQQQQEGTQ